MLSEILIAFGYVFGGIFLLACVEVIHKFLFERKG
jgi:hypothetical protein